MKKVPIYFAVAVFLGLLLTLVPLALIRTEKPNVIARFSGLEESKEAYGLDAPKYSVAGLEIFAISFIIASVAYVFFKFRMSH